VFTAAKLKVFMLLFLFSKCVQKRKRSVAALQQHVLRRSRHWHRGLLLPEAQSPRASRISGRTEVSSRVSAVGRKAMMMATSPRLTPTPLSRSPADEYLIIIFQDNGN
jgi:hypothetical protein